MLAVQKTFLTVGHEHNHTLLSQRLLCSFRFSIRNKSQTAKYAMPTVSR